MTIQEVAEFYGCTAEQIEYYMRLSGTDPSLFIPEKEPSREELEWASAYAERIVGMAENASCLEDQAPTEFLPALCRKILTYKKIVGVRA